MRVLWFTGVQLPAVTGQTLTRAGWQEGLRRALERFAPDIELGIASFGSKEYAPIQAGNATYFNILRIPPSGKWARIRKAWQHEDFNEAELSRCQKIVEEFKPDLIHFHGTENPFGLIADRISAPSVLSLQAVVNGCFPFLFAGMSNAEIRRQIFSRDFLRGNGVVHKYWQWKKYVQVEQRIFQACPNYIGRTHWDQTLLRAFNPAARYFHGDEVMAEPFYQAQWTAENARPGVIFTTSSNAFFKGSVMLVDALEVLKRMGLKNIQVRMAGVDLQGEVGRQIRARIEKYHLSAQVELLGRLTPDQIIGEMQSASVFVLPSHIDNSPNSLCEAMLLGMPCVASNVGGVSSLMQDGVEGLLYHDRDPYALAMQIQRILSDRELAATLGKEARATALDRHAPQAVAAQTAAAYQAILSH